MTSWVDAITCFVTRTEFTILLVVGCRLHWSIIYQASGQDGFFHLSVIPGYLCGHHRVRQQLYSLGRSSETRERIWTLSALRRTSTWNGKFRLLILNLNLKTKSYILNLICFNRKSRLLIFAWSHDMLREIKLEKVGRNYSTGKAKKKNLRIYWRS